MPIARQLFRSPLLSPLPSTPIKSASPARVFIRLAPPSLATRTRSYVSLPGPMSNTLELKKAFLSQPHFAVVGASKDATKFGTKVCLLYPTAHRSMADHDRPFRS